MLVPVKVQLFQYPPDLVGLFIRTVGAPWIIAEHHVRTDGLTDGGLSAACAGAPALERLDISGCSLICQPEWLGGARLRSLRASGCDAIADDAITACCARSPGLTNLTLPLCAALVGRIPVVGGLVVDEHDPSFGLVAIAAAGLNAPVSRAAESGDVQTLLRLRGATEARPFAFLDLGRLAYLGGGEALSQVRSEPSASHTHIHTPRD